MINKKVIFLSVLLSFSLVSSNATAMPNLKNLLNLKKSIHYLIKSPPIKYAVGLALAGIVGWNVFRWFKPAKASNFSPQRKDLSLPSTANIRTNNISPTLSPVEQENNSKKKQPATFACRERKLRPVLHRQARSEILRAPTAPEDIINLEPLDLPSIPDAEEIQNKALKNIYRIASTGTTSNLNLAFLTDGMTLNKYSDVRTTAFYCAVKGNNFDVVEFLLDKGVDVNTQDNSGNSPLHFANSPEMIQCLLQRQAEILENDSGRTIFHRAASRPELMDTLISNCRPTLQFELTRHDSLGFTPLMWAFHTQNIDYIDTLLTELSLKCDLRFQTSQQDQKAQSGDSLLQLAVLIDNFDLVQLLVKKFQFQDHIDHKNRHNNETALHVALQFGKYEIAQYLIDNGAHLDVPDRKQKTALNIIQALKNEKPRDIAGFAFAKLDLTNAASSSTAMSRTPVNLLALMATDEPDEDESGYGSMVYTPPPK